MTNWAVSAPTSTAPEIFFTNERLYLRDRHGELDILAVEVLEAKDVFVHSFASL